MSEYVRANMVYEKEDLLISGTGKYHDYDFYRVAGLAIGGKGKGEAENEAPPGRPAGPAAVRQGERETSSSTSPPPWPSSPRCW